MVGVFIFSNIGEVVVIVGGYLLCYEGFNCVFDVFCLIGFLVKLAVYLVALECGFILVSILKDEVVIYMFVNGMIWILENFEKESYGEVLMMVVLVNFYN